MCTHMPDETAQAQHSSELDEQQDHAFPVLWSIPGLAEAQTRHQIKVTSFHTSEMFVLLKKPFGFMVAVPVKQVARMPALAWDTKQIFDSFEDAMVDQSAIFFGTIFSQTFNNSTVFHLQHFILFNLNPWRSKRQV